ncbi:MAG TPA: hypothetical protein DCQ15_11970 [Chitinophagaceae bacterium]|nr:hypothetical protein [Chitinophagaceae bacterium]
MAYTLYNAGITTGGFDIFMSKEAGETKPVIDELKDISKPAPNKIKGRYFFICKQFKIYIKTC